MLHSLLKEIRLANQRLADLESRLDAIAKIRPEVALLRTIPGIGPRSAEAIVAFTDRADRFGNRKQFTSYFGMTPTEDSSGTVHRHGHISKRGPSVVRWLVVEAAHRVIAGCPALRDFYCRIHRGKKDRNKKAVVATGRKVLAICYGMLRDQTAFDADKVWPKVA